MDLQMWCAIHVMHQEIGTKMVNLINWIFDYSIHMALIDLLIHYLIMLSL